MDLRARSPGSPRIQRRDPRGGRPRAPGPWNSELTIEVARPGTRVDPGGGSWTGGGPYRYSSDRRLRYSAGAERVEPQDLGRWLAELPRQGVVLTSRPDVVYRDLVPLMEILQELELPVAWVGVRD